MANDCLKIRKLVNLIPTMNHQYKLVRTAGTLLATINGVSLNLGCVTVMMIVWIIVMKNRIVLVSVVNIGLLENHFKVEHFNRTYVQRSRIPMQIWSMHSINL